MFEGVQGAADLGGVTGGASAAGESLCIADAVTVTHVARSGVGTAPHVLLEWEGGAVGDLLADATVALILQVHSPGNGLLSSVGSFVGHRIHSATRGSRLAICKGIAWRFSARHLLRSRAVDGYLY